MVIASVSNLSIHYGKRAAVDGLSFDLHGGEITLLLGPNGAGKSTTLAAMAGAVLPSAGTITVGGEDLATAPRSARRKVGFADQPPALYEYFTVVEHVGFVAEARGADVAAAERVLADLGLAKIAGRPCRELSFGMRQRVGLAAALVGPIELALLDETLNGLDPHASRAARATLRATADRGAAILMSTHLLGVAERMCDRILLVDKGKLVADRRGDDVKALLAQGPAAVEELYVSLIADEGPT
ncbi:MAG: ABC transporter ATP-binding protein [Deltaproteobacteria bacterium]|nr:ABC transporter ATP-binding protein [Deltaproteobacteria bacterium]